ncbi:MAG: TonB family protein [Porticoccaceae bacterium]|nr:TonB family protein [Porticoccaceae bacterium]
MDVSFTTADPHQGNDRLGFAIFLAIALHSLIIFGVGFDFLKSQPSATALDVTLAQHPTAETVDDAAYIAQASQQGSGNISDEKNEITTDQIADYAADVLRYTKPLQPTQARQASAQMAKRTITTIEDSEAITQQIAESGEQTSPSLDQQIAPTLVKEFSSLRAQLDNQKQAYSKLPNILRLTSASTKQADHATYLKYWIDKVELTGNRHYPPEARYKKLFGELQLAVTVLPDGTVEGVEILQSSKHHVLDQAAVETVRLAAPFSAFPKEMATWHKIEIIQTWRFSPDHRMHSK